MKKYSIIIVSRNSSKVLPHCLNSIVRSSGGADYEVIIVDNASSDESADLFNALEGDVKVIRNQYNSGFARACNQGLHSARGEYLVFLNPDTLVTENWLEKMSAHFRKGKAGAVGPLSNYVAGMQKYGLFYNGKDAETPDEINAALCSEFRGKSVETKFLIGFCLMVPRKVMEETGPFDPDLILGNEDLEYSRRLRSAGYQLHIALDTFVYHQGQESFSGETGAEQWVNFSARILQAKLMRELGEVDPMKIWGMDWFQPHLNPLQDLVSIIIPTLNGLQYTKACIDSIRRRTIHPCEIIVVDNGSTDGTVEFLRSQSDVKLIANGENRGYPAACNQGINASTAPYALLMNNDVVVTDGWLHRMFAGFFASPDAGLIGPRTGDSAGFQQVESPGYSSPEELEEFAEKLRQSSVRQFREVNYITGFCMLIDRRVIDKIGLLDERFGLGNYEDQDFCRRALKAGFKAFVANEVFVHHFGSRSFLENNFDYGEILEENRRKYELKWSEAGV